MASRLYDSKNNKEYTFGNPLGGNPIYIGKGSGCDVRLSGQGVALVHARLTSHPIGDTEVLQYTITPINDNSILVKGEEVTSYGLVNKILEEDEEEVFGREEQNN